MEGKSILPARSGIPELAGRPEGYSKDRERENFPVCETRSIDAARPDDIDTLVELLLELFAIESDFDFDANLQRRGL